MLSRFYMLLWIHFEDEVWSTEKSEVAFKVLILGRACCLFFSESDEKGCLDFLSKKDKIYLTSQLNDQKGDNFLVHDTFTTL